MTKEPTQRRLAAILAADVVGYSKLMGQDEEGTLAALTAHIQDHIRPSIDNHQGRVVKTTGDGLLAEFSSAVNAVRCAVDIQQGMAERNKDGEESPHIEFRIGVNLGDVIIQNDDVFGDGVNIAARIEAIAKPGGILISSSVYDQVNQRVTASFEDMGAQTLKNIDAPVRVFNVTMPGLNSGAVSAKAASKATGKDNAGTNVGNKGEVAQNNTSRSKLPVIAIEKISVPSANDDASEAAADLHYQLLERFSRRTGIRVIDAANGDAKSADYLLKGRLRVSPNATRLTMSMVLQSDGSIFWSDSYEFAVDDLFAFVDQAASRIDIELRQTINKFDGERLGQLSDDELNASELMSRAANGFYEMSIASYERSTNLLEKAIALEPENPMGLAMWAHGWTWICGTRLEGPQPDLALKITERSETASQAMPSSDFVGKTRVDVLLKINRDPGAARRALSRTSRINPTYSFFKTLEIEIALAHGEWDEADRLVIAFHKDYPRDIHAGYSHYLRAIAQLMIGDNEGAIASIDEAIELRPRSRIFRAIPVVVNRRLGNTTAEAEASARMARVPQEVDIFSQYVLLPPEKADFMQELVEIVSVKND